MRGEIGKAPRLGYSRAHTYKNPEYQEWKIAMRLLTATRLISPEIHIHIFDFVLYSVLYTYIPQFTANSNPTVNGKLF